MRGKNGEGFSVYGQRRPLRWCCLSHDDKTKKPGRRRDSWNGEKYIWRQENDPYLEEMKEVQGSKNIMEGDHAGWKEREAESRSCGALQGTLKDFWVLLRTFQSLKILKQRSEIIFKISLSFRLELKARVKAKTLCYYHHWGKTVLTGTGVAAIEMREWKRWYMYT